MNKNLRGIATRRHQGLARQGSKRVVFQVAALALLLVGAVASGCGARNELYVGDPRPAEGGRGGMAGSGGEGGEGGTPPKVRRASAVDLLLLVDNSRSMADKQELLGLAVPDLIAGLVNPPCLDKNGVPAQPNPARNSPAPAAAHAASRR